MSLPPRGEGKVLVRVAQLEALHDKVEELYHGDAVDDVDADHGGLVGLAQGRMVLEAGEDKLVDQSDGVLTRGAMRQGGAKGGDAEWLRNFTSTMSASSPEACRCMKSLTRASWRTPGSEVPSPRSRVRNTLTRSSIEHASSCFRRASSRALKPDLRRPKRGDRWVGVGGCG